ncbi:unnamed protein product [Rodentolepis nana]|uniref:COPIIcoated_ERV domain-containing protein n=1 Tax=Rodentolepis nana TaxID=102285 RepID=A0A0R3T1X3_RODNA|nr:unnamed protein product [Rodentolepis nana]
MGKNILWYTPVGLRSDSESIYGSQHVKTFILHSRSNFINTSYHQDKMAHGFHFQVGLGFEQDNVATRVKYKIERAGDKRDVVSEDLVSSLKPNVPNQPACDHEAELVNTQ